MPGVNHLGIENPNKSNSPGIEALSRAVLVGEEGDLVQGLGAELRDRSREIKLPEEVFCPTALNGQKRLDVLLVNLEASFEPLLNFGEGVGTINSSEEQAKTPPRPLSYFFSTSSTYPAGSASEGRGFSCEPGSKCKGLATNSSICSTSHGHSV